MLRLILKRDPTQLYRNNMHEIMVYIDEYGKIDEIPLLHFLGIFTQGPNSLSHSAIKDIEMRIYHVLTSQRGDEIKRLEDDLYTRYQYHRRRMSDQRAMTLSGIGMSSSQFYATGINKNTDPISIETPNNIWSKKDKDIYYLLTS